MQPLPPPPPSSSGSIPLTPTPPRPPRSSRAVLVGVAAAVAIAVAVAVVLVARGDDDASGASTTATSASGAVSTTAAAPSTTLPSGPVVVPDGALDLGDGVFLPLDAGVEVSGTVDPFTITNDSVASTMILQVVRREPGEDPNVLLQEYIDIFDGDYTLVAYLPSETFPPGVEGFDSLRFSRVTYVLYQPDAESQNVVGEIGVWMRNDGLTILSDLYGSAARPISDGAFGGMIGSLAAAPALGPPVAWSPAAARMPDTVHQGADLPFNPTRQLVLPKGFDVVARSDESITVTNNSDTVTVSVGLDVADRAAAHAGASQVVSDTYGSTDVGAFVPTGSGLLTFDRTTWTGTDADGDAVTGEVWLQFDAPSQTVVVVVMAHLSEDWDANYMAMMAASVAGSGPAAAGSAGGG